MTNEELIQKTMLYAKETLGADVTGHDWWHVYRVWKMARTLAQREGADVFVVEIAALLHDIADWKFCGGEESLGGVRAAEWLESQGASPKLTAHVADIVSTLSFKGALVRTPMATLEGAIVQDADRLDALGAIGVARTFAYGGAKGRPIYNPEEQPAMHDSFVAYKGSTSSTLMHFYEKLLLLKDRINTRSAREIAEKRHNFLVQFLDHFHAEWDFSAENSELIG